jgi:hypothetical protein
VSYSGRNDYYGEQWPTFGFNGPVTFKGTNAYTLANNSGSAVLFGGAGMSDVIVDESRKTRMPMSRSHADVNGLTGINEGRKVIVGTRSAAPRNSARKGGHARAERLPPLYRKR